MTMLRISLLLVALGSLPLPATAVDHQVVSPNGKVSVTISQADGLTYSVALDGQTIVLPSKLGLAFDGGVVLGAHSTIGQVEHDSIDTSWENPFGNRRVVPDRYGQLRLTVTSPDQRSFGLIVRAYDDGVAFRYDIPRESGFEQFAVTDELTEFRFDAPQRCWLGTPNSSDESHYRQHGPEEIGPGHQGVLPLLVQTPAGWAAVAESDVRDWSGMWIQGDSAGSFRVHLADRADKRAKVISTAPRLTPWRVIMIGASEADLIGNDLVATLATPSQIGDISWIRAGAAAWDAWWTGVNPDDPGGHRGLEARGTTASHKRYIDLAASMGWPYQLMDWLWYEDMTSYNKGLLAPPNSRPGDFDKPVPGIDIPELVEYARSKDVRLLIWAHSLDVKTTGIDQTMERLAAYGFAGVKVDFINSQSQEAVLWCEQVLAAAARHRLIVDFHGIYKPTGLARTYPNYLTQEGVFGNEYNKMNRGVTPAHQLSLVFTRGLLGPMDYTPGGFLNRRPDAFAPASPTAVQGTRARELALPVLYLSPLTVFCDSPENYQNQPGLEFYRDFPTVWDDTVVVSAAMNGHAVVARRSGSSWRIGAINHGEPIELSVPLAFLKSGQWTLRAFADSAEPNAPADRVVETTTVVQADDVLTLRLSADGGYAAILTPSEE